MQQVWLGVHSSNEPAQLQATGVPQLLVTETPHWVPQVVATGSALHTHFLLALQVQPDGQPPPRVPHCWVTPQLSTALPQSRPAQGSDEGVQHT